MEFKQDRAQACAKALLTLDAEDWRAFLVGVLRSYVDFRETTREAESYASQFLSDLELLERHIESDSLICLLDWRQELSQSNLFSREINEEYGTSE